MALPSFQGSKTSYDVIISGIFLCWCCCLWHVPFHKKEADELSSWWAFIVRLTSCHFANYLVVVVLWNPSEIIRGRSFSCFGPPTELSQNSDTRAVFKVLDTAGWPDPTNLNQISQRWWPNPLQKPHPSLSESSWVICREKKGHIR